VLTYPPYLSICLHTSIFSIYLLSISVSDSWAGKSEESAGFSTAETTGKFAYELFMTLVIFWNCLEIPFRLAFVPAVPLAYYVRRFCPSAVLLLLLLLLLLPWTGVLCEEILSRAVLLLLLLLPWTAVCLAYYV
jgi:hypothetical protein